MGELTRIVPFEMVDAAIEQTGRVQTRVRSLPARVVVYLLLAAGLFGDCGYGQVWSRLIAGLTALRLPIPSASAMAQARRRLGPAPLRSLFDTLAGPAATGSRAGVWWRGRLVTAVDGTILCCQDTSANLDVYRKGGGPHGGTGYPMVRLLALVACGTRTVIAVTFGSISTGETTYTRDLLASLHERMIVLADRNFAAADLIERIVDTGADLLIRVKAGRNLPVCRRLPDGSWLSRIGQVEVRVIRCQVTLTTSSGTRGEIYQLVTTVRDADCPATDLVRLYHDRWEIETAFLEMKHTILHGRVLRARTPDGVEQEIYALLTGYQALRIAIADSTIGTELDPDRASFTIALHAARDQITAAAGIVADTRIDLRGEIGRQVLEHPMPPRRLRTSPRVVKRAISTYAPHTASGRLRGPTQPATLNISILTADGP